jgi:hypothetical protein
MTTPLVIELHTVDDILARLVKLEQSLENQGLYTDSNTVWLAQKVISELLSDRQ